MGKRITVVLLAGLAAISIACGTTGAGAGGREEPRAGGPTLDAGYVDYSDGAQGTMSDSSNGPSLQP
jgi:hypothetical protein